jgi:hypothetical protein
MPGELIICLQQARVSKVSKHVVEHSRSESDWCTCPRVVLCMCGGEGGKWLCSDRW